MQDEARTGNSLDRDWLYSLYRRTMRPYVEPTWGWDEAVQSRGFDEQLGVENFRIISLNRADVGGYCLRSKENCLWLDMLLIEPEHQSSGIGRRVMNSIHSQAEASKLTVRLCSIRANPATDFYKHLGYIEYKEDATLSYLEWTS